MPCFILDLCQDNHDLNWGYVLQSYEIKARIKNKKPSLLLFLLLFHSHFFLFTFYLLLFTLKAFLPFTFYFKIFYFSLRVVSSTR